MHDGKSVLNRPPYSAFLFLIAIVLEVVRYNTIVSSKMHDEIDYLINSGDH
jgi:hypothetical protein